MDAGPQNPELAYADPSLTRRRPRGRRFLALAATLLAWGLGHWIAGSRRRGLGWLVVWVVLIAAAFVCAAVPRLLPALIVLLPLQVVAFLAVMIDALIVAGRSDRSMLPTAAARYLVGVALLGVALFLHPGMLLARYLRSHWVEAFALPSRLSSMAPALQAGDRILVHKRPWPVRRWDVVALEPPDVPGAKWVFRVAGLPGEKVEVADGKVRVNDVPLDPPPGVGPHEGQFRLVEEGNGVEGRPIALGAREYFVLGDNSPVAGDSRYWRKPAGAHQPGALPAENIIGRVTAIYWPPNRWRMFESQ